jgi:hypothetical protein
VTRGDERFAAETARRVSQALERNPDTALVPRAVLGRTLTTHAIRRLLVNFLAAERALTVTAPAVVVIPDERQPLARLLGLEARRRQVPIVSAPLNRDQMYRKTPLWNDVVSSSILTSSPSAARFMTRAGVGRDRVDIVDLENRPRSGSAASRATARVLRARQDAPSVVLFASQGRPDNAAMLPMIAASVDALPGATLVVRPHPVEWPALVRLMNRGVALSTEPTAEDAISNADVVVTHSSSLAIDAARIGRPAVLLSIDGVPQLLPLLDEGLARFATTREQLQEMLVDVLGPGRSESDAAQRRFRAELDRVAPQDRAGSIIAGLASVMSGR